jgi:DNA-binding GntR family transcriptional regulator
VRAYENFRQSTIAFLKVDTMQARPAQAVVRATSVSEMVHQYLKDSILSGALLAGHAIRQDDIATRLDVSRAPVREALNQLEREGLVVLRPRRGYIVASLDPDEIEDIFRIRMVLEEHAGLIATERRTLTDVVAAKKLVRAMDGISAETSDGIAEWASLNREFHDTIYRASGVNRLRTITANLRDTVEQYVRLDLATANWRGAAQKEHRRILAAFEAGDAKAVAHLSREHCQNTCERLISSLKRRRATGHSGRQADMRTNGREP